MVWHVVTSSLSTCVTVILHVVGPAVLTNLNYIRTQILYYTIYCTYTQYHTRTDVTSGYMQMYEHILEIERQVFWMYGNVTCAAYPLQHIDTISEETGEINTTSAMYHIVQGVSCRVLTSSTLD